MQKPTPRATPREEHALASIKHAERRANCTNAAKKRKVEPVLKLDLAPPGDIPLKQTQEINALLLTLNHSNPYATRVKAATVGEQYLTCCAKWGNSPFPPTQLSVALFLNSKLKSCNCKTVRGYLADLKRFTIEMQASKWKLDKNPLIKQLFSAFDHLKPVRDRKPKFIFRVGILRAILPLIYSDNGGTVPTHDDICLLEQQVLCQGTSCLLPAGCWPADWDLTGCC